MRPSQPARFALPFVFVATSLLGASCAAETNAEPTAQVEAIRGGMVEDGYPQVGILEFSTGRFGTGTLIAPNVVLTAGHVVGGNITGFYVGRGYAVEAYMGETPTTMMRRYEVLERVAHPDYTGTSGPDMGLVRLAENVTEMAPIPITTRLPEIGDTCTAVGYGRHEHPSDPMSATLFLVKEKRSALVDITRIGMQYVSATWNTGIPDHGDSGGPLLCGGEIVGEVCCKFDGEWPGHRTEAYTRISLGAEWINERVVEWGNPPIDFERNDAGEPDAGVPNDDAATFADAGQPAPAPSCGCAAGSTSASWSWAALAGLAGVIAARRKRR